MRERSQMKPGVREREKCRSRCYPVSSFHVLLPTEFCALLALDTGHLRIQVIHEDIYASNPSKLVHSPEQRNVFLRRSYIAYETNYRPLDPHGEKWRSGGSIDSIRFEV